jgi:hypothetical protein
MDKRKCSVFDAVSFSGLTARYCLDIRKFLLLICFGTAAVGILLGPQQYLIYFVFVSIILNIGSCLPDSYSVSVAMETVTSWAVI